MYLMYVDESGDCGLINSPTRYFVLTGLVFHELRWREYLTRMIDFRRRIRLLHGLKLREEIHASAMLNNPKDLIRIRKHDRLAIIRALIDEISQMADLNIINIVVNKQGKPATYDVFEKAWEALIQRFENTITHRNFRGPVNADERGMIFPDHTDDKKLTTILRRMRHYNPIPHHPAVGRMGYRNILLNNIIGDPKFRLSHTSYFIQAADAAAFALYQRFTPSGYIRRKSGQNYFLKLDPVLCKVASQGDPHGIVRL
jgi:hypothetical protein